MVTWRSAFRLGLLTLFSVLFSTACSFWAAPELQSRRQYDPIIELFVVNNLAETLTSIELDRSGRFIGTQDDIAILGSVPNGIISTGSELLVTLSGENRLLFLDESTCVTTGSIDLGSGVNPMVTAEIGPNLYGTTGLFSGRLHIYKRDGSALLEPVTSPVDSRAPQSVITIRTTGGGPGEVRVLVANTAYSSTRPASEPYGVGTLTVFRISTDGSALSIIDSKTYGLEDSGSGTVGLNPQQIIDIPATGEILVIGAGVNYGGGSGEDDGVVLVLDRDELIDETTLPPPGTDIVKQRMPIGGSPGAGVVLGPTDGVYTLITAGTTALRAIVRDGSGSTPWKEPGSSSDAVVYDATGTGTGTGGLPFLSDIVAWERSAGNYSVYVADFGNDRVLRFSFDGAVGLTFREAQTVSDGPIALLLGIE